MPSTGRLRKQRDLVYINMLRKWATYMLRKLALTKLHTHEQLQLVGLIVTRITKDEDERGIMANPAQTCLTVIAMLLYTAMAFLFETYFGI